MQRVQSYLMSIKPSETIIWFLGALHTLVALSLIFILSGLTPAHASDDPSCGGHDILAELRSEKPDTYAKIEEAAAQIKNGHSIFWKIEKEGVPTSYLLGTMHVSDPRVINMPDGAQAAFEAASSLIVESTDALDQQKAAATLLTRPDLTMFTDGKSISDYLSADDKALLEEQLKTRGIPFFSVSNMKPWLVTAFVAQPTCELQRKAKGALFLDQKLVSDAEDAGKSVVGLETMVEQLEIMASLPMEMHVKGLVESLKDPQQTLDLMETLVTLYDEGRPGWIRPISDYAYPEDKTGFSMAEFEAKMITLRNYNMAERAKDQLNAGGAFMAVGALHLPGDEGLVELLRADGFTLTTAQ